MYYNDHEPPHFHAVYGEFEVQIVIETLVVLRGELPRRAQALVLEWAHQHRTELLHDWELARAGVRLDDIPPLD